MPLPVRARPSVSVTGFIAEKAILSDKRAAKCHSRSSGAGEQQAALRHGEAGAVVAQSSEAAFVLSAPRCPTHHAPLAYRQTRIQTIPVPAERLPA